MHTEHPDLWLFPRVMSGRSQYTSHASLLYWRKISGANPHLVEPAVEQNYQGGTLHRIPKCSQLQIIPAVHQVNMDVLCHPHVEVFLCSEGAAVWFTVINTHILAFSQGSCVLLKIPKRRQQITGTCRTLNLRESFSGCLCSTGRFFCHW